MTVEITYLHDWTVQLNGGTYGLAQMNNADPHCFVYLSTWIMTLPISLMTCVVSYAGLLAGVFSTVAWLISRPTPNKRAARERRDCALVPTEDHRRGVGEPQRSGDNSSGAKRKS